MLISLERGQAVLHFIGGQIHLKAFPEDLLGMRVDPVKAMACVQYFVNHEQEVMNWFDQFVKGRMADKVLAMESQQLILPPELKQ